MFVKADLIYLLTVAVLMLIPNRIEQATYVKIQQPMAVVMHKNFPPYLAHLEVNKRASAELEQTHTTQTFQLSTADLLQNAQLFSERDVQHFVLDEVRLSKRELAKYEVLEPLLVNSEVEATESQSDKAWIQSLPRMQKLRLEMAQQKSDILEPETKAAFSKSGFFKPNPSANIVNQKLIAKSVVNQTSSGGQLPSTESNDAASFIGGSNSGSLVAANSKALIERNPMPSATETTTKKVNNGFNLKGTIEMVGGLAVTHEHTIDIRHLQEGIYQERGLVNLQDGTYQIHIDDPAGVIQARLIARDGEIIGEGQFRVTSLDLTNVEKIEFRGPKLVLSPKRALAGSFYSQYTVGARKSVPQAQVSFLHGTESAKLDIDQRIHENRLAEGSQTLVSVDSKQYQVSQKIVTSGDEFEMPLMPTKMVKSLRQIVSDLRQQDLNDPDGTIIWGQAKIDGRALSGVSVEVESAPEIEPIYFNEFFLPDPTLKATSSNGIYAFLEVQPGFHSLVARRGEKYFAHDNVIVEKAAVTLSELKNTMSNKMAQIKTFDAFTGQPKNTRLEIQSSEEAIQTENGQAHLLLPDVHRLSLIQVPHVENYAAGIYQYDDSTDFIHIPLVTEDWLISVRNYLKLDDVPNVGTVVGFVGDENFEVFTAENDDQIVKVYFDQEGRILDRKSGVLGGGFILFNVPQGTNETIIYGLKTEKLYSKVIPVDVSSLNVLSFHSEY